MHCITAVTHAVSLVHLVIEDKKHPAPQWLLKHNPVSAPQWPRADIPPRTGQATPSAQAQVRNASSPSKTGRYTSQRPHLPCIRPPPATAEATPAQPAQWGPRKAGRALIATTTTTTSTRPTRHRARDTQRGGTRRRSPGLRPHGGTPLAENCRARRYRGGHPIDTTSTATVENADTPSRDGESRQTSQPAPWTPTMTIPTATMARRRRVSIQDTDMSQPAMVATLRAWLQGPEDILQIHSTRKR